MAADNNRVAWLVGIGLVAIAITNRVYNPRPPVQPSSEKPASITQSAEPARNQVDDRAAAKRRLMATAMQTSFWDQGLDITVTTLCDDRVLNVKGPQFNRPGAYLFHKTLVSSGATRSAWDAGFDGVELVGPDETWRWPIRRSAKNWCTSDN